MRRILVAGLAGALLLTACTDDGDPTIDLPPSETADDSPTPDASESLAESSPSPSQATEAPTVTENPTSSEPVEGTDAGLTLVAELTGDAEVPGPGDTGGSGTFAGTLSSTENGGELCYVLRVDGLGGEATAAHVHEGVMGASGGPVITLTAPTAGEVEECVPVNATEMVPLLDDPDGFYVNVHTDDFPDGAVRGQLSVA